MRLLIGLVLVVSAALLFTDNPSLLVRVTDFVVVAFVGGAILFVRGARTPLTCETCRNSMVSVAAGLECTNKLHHEHAARRLRGARRPMHRV